MNEDYEHNYRIGYMQGIIIGAAAAYGAFNIIKLGIDWTKAGIQEYRERKEK